MGATFYWSGCTVGRDIDKLPGYHIAFKWKKLKTDGNTDSGIFPRML